MTARGAGAAVDLLAASAIGAAVAILLGAHLEARIASVAWRANDPWRWSIAAVVIVAARIAIAHRLAHVPAGAAARDVLRSVLTRAVFVTMAAAVLTGLVTSCGGLDSASYLGAAEMFQGHREAAQAIYRQLVQLDARGRPDPLVFPPDVQQLFEEVSRTYGRDRS